MATGIYVGVNKVLAPEVSGSTIDVELPIDGTYTEDLGYLTDCDPVFGSHESFDEPQVLIGSIIDFLGEIITYGFYNDEGFNFDKEGAVWYKVENVTKDDTNYYYSITPYILKKQPPGVARKVAKAYLGIGNNRTYTLEEVSKSTNETIVISENVSEVAGAWIATSPLNEDGTLKAYNNMRGNYLSTILDDIGYTDENFAYVDFGSHIYKYENPHGGFGTPPVTRAPSQYDYFTIGTQTKYLLKPNYGAPGVAHKVKKGYLGDSSGKARLFFSSGPKIVSWATGTDEEVAAMITAAHNGDIKLADYWNIGDTRTVNLSAGQNGGGFPISAQSVQLVLAHKPTSSSYYGGGEFIINQKNCLSADHIMNGGDDNTGSFAGSAMARFLNNSNTGYLSMLPSWLRNVLLDAKVITAQTYNGTTNQISTHKVFLPAAKEVFGGTATSAGQNTSWSNLTEFNALEQWEWFKTSANRIKKINNTNSIWWLRSPDCQNSIRFCAVSSYGTSDYRTTSASHGVAPAMLI